MMKKRRRKSIITTTMMIIQSQKLSLRAVLIPILMVTPVLKSQVMTLEELALVMILVELALMMILEELAVVQTSLLYILKNGENTHFVPHCFLVMIFMHYSDGLSTPIKKSSTARWFTGCYINYEDKCFTDKLFGTPDPPETFEEKHTRCFPVPMDFRKKEPLKTNGASSKLGFTVLLDPMLHDQINGKKMYYQNMKLL